MTDRPVADMSQARTSVIFEYLSIAGGALRAVGRYQDAAEMRNRVMAEALHDADAFPIMAEYVEMHW